MLVNFNDHIRVGKSIFKIIQSVMACSQKSLNLVPKFSIAMLSLTQATWFLTRILNYLMCDIFIISTPGFRSTLHFCN